jgi:hypothetical protein
MSEIFEVNIAKIHSIRRIVKKNAVLDIRFECKMQQGYGLKYAEKHRDRYKKKEIE